MNMSRVYQFKVTSATIHSTCLQSGREQQEVSKFYRTQSITLMPVMLFGKLACVQCKHAVMLHVHPRTLSVK